MLLAFMSKRPEPCRSLNKVELKAAMNGCDPEPRKSTTASAGLPPAPLIHVVMSCANAVAASATNKVLDPATVSQFSHGRFFSVDFRIIVLIGTKAPRLHRYVQIAPAMAVAD